MERRSIGFAVGEITDNSYKPEISVDEKDQEEDLLKILMEIFSSNCTSENFEGMDYLMFVF